MAKILLIDDDADLVQYLQMELQAQGYSVQCLDRAEKCPESLAQNSYDLVLLDNKMPGMTGIEFLVKTRQHNPNLPVVLMTGHGTIDTAIQAVNLGAFDYITKPMDYGQLATELKPLIELAVEYARASKVAVRLPGEQPLTPFPSPSERGERGEGAEPVLSPNGFSGSAC